MPFLGGVEAVVGDERGARVDRDAPIPDEVSSLGAGAALLRGVGPEELGHLLGTMRDAYVDRGSAGRPCADQIMRLAVGTIVSHTDDEGTVSYYVTGAGIKIFERFLNSPQNV